MSRTLLGVILMIVAAVVMGCTDSFIPCASDEECTLEFGGDSGSADWEAPGMVCNLDVSPQEKCNDLFGSLPSFDWLPIPLPDCDSLPADGGVCESSWGGF